MSTWIRYFLAPKNLFVQEIVAYLFAFFQNMIIKNIY